MVSSTLRPHFTPGKDPVPILQEAGWAAGPVWTGVKSRRHRDSIPDRPARSQSLYRLSCVCVCVYIHIYMCVCVCVYVCELKFYIYIYKCVCVCVYVYELNLYIYIFVVKFLVEEVAQLICPPSTSSFCRHYHFSDAPYASAFTR